MSLPALITILLVYSCSSFLLSLKSCCCLSISFKVSSVFPISLILLVAWINHHLWKGRVVSVFFNSRNFWPYYRIHLQHNRLIMWRSGDKGGHQIWRSLVQASVREGTFFLGGVRAGASEGRVISESEHQRGRAIPSFSAIQGEGHTFSRIYFHGIPVVLEHHQQNELLLLPQPKHFFPCLLSSRFQALNL